MGCSPSATHSEVKQWEKVRSQNFHEKYVLGVKLGRGAFAQVRACKKSVERPLHLRTGEDHDEHEPKKERAVKILMLTNKEKPDEVNEKLLNVAQVEAQIWKTLGNHPNIVNLYDVFFDDQLCYMVMEKCSGRLFEALQSMPELTERGLGNVFAQMLLGISHCHSHSVIHRDIKPDNFLVGGKDGQVVKLADYGLSTMCKSQGKANKGSYGVFGTAPFMCPEMLQGLWYNEKADVWSFAAMVYVLLLGRFPYMPKQPNSKAMKQAIIDDNPPPDFAQVKMSNGHHTGCSSTAREFVQTLLNRDPARRPSAEEALNMEYMRASLQGEHMPGVDLPSIRPLLHAAKKCGAFETWQPAHSPIDDLLNEAQLKAHGAQLPRCSTNGQPPLPGREPTSTSTRTKDSKDRLPCFEKKHVSKDAWEKSTSSTATGESSSGRSSIASGADTHASGASFRCSRGTQDTRGTMGLPSIDATTFQTSQGVDFSFKPKGAAR